ARDCRVVLIQNSIGEVTRGRVAAKSLEENAAIAIGCRVAAAAWKRRVQMIVGGNWGWKGTSPGLRIQIVVVGSTKRLKAVVDPTVGLRQKEAAARHVDRVSQTEVTVVVTWRTGRITAGRRAADQELRLCRCRAGRHKPQHARQNEMSLHWFFPIKKSTN